MTSSYGEEAEAWRGEVMELWRELVKGGSGVILLVSFYTTPSHCLG